MQKIMISLSLTLVIAAALVTVLFLNKEAGPSEELSALRNQLNTNQETMEALADRIEELESRLASQQDPKNMDVTAMQPTDPVSVKAVQNTKPVTPEAGPGNAGLAATAFSGDGGEGDVSPPDLLKPVAGEMEQYVFSLIDKERKRQREVRQQRHKERQQRIKALSQGPYEKLNLKVNSLGVVLNMDANQKDRYFELSRDYGKELQDLHKNVKWQDEESRNNFTKEQKRLTASFDEEVEGILTSEQIEQYRTLPHWSKNPMNQGYVQPPDENKPAMGAFINGITLDAFDAGPHVIHVETTVSD